MPPESVESNLRHLESLRIVRPRERESRARRSPFVSFAIAIVIITLLFVAGNAIYSNTLGRPPQVQTVIAQMKQGRALGVILTGSGYVVTRHKYITIGTKILGQIVEEPIEEGQHIQKGDVLARIDDRDYQAQLRQAIAARDLSEANVRLSSAKAARALVLYKNQVISKDDFDTATNAAEVARATLRHDEASIEYAKFQVDQCVITSPISGIVLQKYRELGDTINFGGQLQPGSGATDIAQLADTDDMRAEVDINEADIAKVAIGSQATVVPDAYVDRRFDASLVKVYPEADRQKATVKVEVQIRKADLQIIKPEMSVKVSFLENGTATNEEPSLTIPKNALRTEGNESYVWTVRDGVARRVVVLRGREIENGVEVTRGLTDGDMIIVRPPDNLSDGQKVMVEHDGSATGQDSR